MGVAGSDEIEVLTRFAMDQINILGNEALSFYGKSKPGVKFDQELVTSAELHLADFFKCA